MGLFEDLINKAHLARAEIEREKDFQKQGSNLFCKDCKAFSNKPQGLSSVKWGECRKKSPKSIEDHRRWPTVDEHNWCLEFVKK